MFLCIDWPVPLTCPRLKPPLFVPACTCTAQVKIANVSRLPR